MPIGNHKLLKKDIAAGIVPFTECDTGIISDDTIFTMAGMNGITKAKKIDLQVLFDAHKILFEKYGKYGFGDNTKSSFEKYQLG